MDIQDAVNAPRIHHQWLPDRIRLEGEAWPDGGEAFAAETVEALEALGHRVQVGGRQGSANSIGIDPVSGERIGAPDPRSADSGARGR
jgi:gamma-glutamyltranspeptidase/glutathione hydrolase